MSVEQFYQCPPQLVACWVALASSQSLPGLDLASIITGFQDPSTSSSSSSASPLASLAGAASLLSSLPTSSLPAADQRLVSSSAELLAHPSPAALGALIDGLPGGAGRRELLHSSTAIAANPSLGALVRLVEALGLVVYPNGAVVPPDTAAVVAARAAFARAGGQVVPSLPGVNAPDYPSAAPAPAPAPFAPAPVEAAPAPVAAPAPFAPVAPVAAIAPALPTITYSTALPTSAYSTVLSYRPSLAYVGGLPYAYRYHTLPVTYLG